MKEETFEPRYYGGINTLSAKEELNAHHIGEIKMLSSIGKYLIYHLTFVLMLFLLNSCDQMIPLQPNSPSPKDYFFSFEDDMEDWTVNGIDLDNPPVEWSIERSKDIASHGNNSVKFYLNNVNDAGKIWLEKPFPVKPNSFYKVRVEYNFASSDWGDFNLFRIITGALPEKPRSRENLVYQGDTGNDADTEAGYVWLDKSYDFIVQSDSDGILYVIIGVWGTWETSRTYYLDNIHITLTALKGDTTWNLQGLWEVSDVRFDNVVIRTYHITVRQSDSSVKFIRDGEIISAGVISDKMLFCSDWDGYGIAKIYIDNETSMYSEVPQNEFLNRIDFRKIQ